MAEINNQFVSPCRAASYLQARDPSILSWNCHGMDNVRCNLANDFTSVLSCNLESPQKKDEGLNVYLRIKGCVPFGDVYSVQDNVLSCVVPAGCQAAKNMREHRIIIKKYFFSKIFGPETTQEELFDATIREKVLDFINGANSTLLAYGVSGAGKTYTMIGTAQDPGIIPRALNYIFGTVLIDPNNRPCFKPLPNGKINLLNTNQQDFELQVRQRILKDPLTYNELYKHECTFLSMQKTLKVSPVALIDTLPPISELWVSFVEIYNENIYDLLEMIPARGQQKPKLRIGGSHAETYIKGVKHVFVTTGLQAYQVLQFGLHNMSYASTNLNMHSSRAHCIFSIKLISGKDSEHYNVSTFNFCDLAGSERMKKTLNEGDRAKESSKINTSLSVLGRCIRSVREMQKTNADTCSAPFRESKLTQLLQQPLQGKENICMIVNISPSSTMFDETQQALIFSTIAQEIVVQDPKPKEVQVEGLFKTFRQSMARRLREDNLLKDEELRNAQNQIAQLTLEMSELKQNFEMILEQETDHLRTNYDIIVKIKTRHLEDAEQEILQLRKDIGNLQRAKFDLNSEINKLKKQLVIVLSDSDEDEFEEKEIDRIDEKRLLQDKIEYLENKVQVYLDQIQRNKEAEVDEMKRIRVEKIKMILEDTDQQSKDDLRSKVRDLENTLTEAFRDYSELEENEKSLRVAVNDLTAKNCLLEDEILLLKQELFESRAHSLQQAQELESFKTKLT